MKIKYSAHKSHTKLSSMSFPLTIFSILGFGMGILVLNSCNSASTHNQEMGPPYQVTFQNNEADKTIDVLIDDELFTTLRWQENLTKPVLHPIHTARGTAITRGFPLNPKPGERADHPHQIGNWFTYGNVNGSDFWGNGSKGLGTINANGGKIRLTSIEQLEEGEGEGKLTTTAQWIDSAGNFLLDEETAYHFRAVDSIRLIDRAVKLTAGSLPVSMPDTKEGMFGIRVARELELPAQGEITLYSASGTPEKITERNNETISGNYLSSTGEEGIGVWGTRARWMNLSGTIEGEDISIAICDHPDNPNYPTWWHARGYGLFAANPLGAKDFTKNEISADFKIPADNSVTFRYRIVISSGQHLTDEVINDFADQFAEL